MPESFYFICYSRLDLATAIKLADQLTAGPPSIAVWLDKRNIQPGIDWDLQIAEALSTCAGVLYLMTDDSVSNNSECRREWERALTYKKPIIPLLFEKSATLPYRLAPRHYIDFTDNFEVGLAKLRDYLRWRGTDEGALHTLKERLGDAKRDLKRAGDERETARIREEIGDLEQQIEQQQAIIADSDGATQKTKAYFENSRTLNCKDIITVKLEDIVKVEVDVVVLKYADNFYGADREVTQALGVDIIDPNNFHIEKGYTRIFSSSGRIGASHILYIGVGDLDSFSYENAREFGVRALSELRTALPATRHIAMTIHGVNYGLDEIESFFSLYAGLCDAIKVGQYPPNLQRIYIIDKNPNRVKHLEGALLKSDNVNRKSGSLDYIMSAGQTSQSKPSIFVAMPFSDEFDDVFYLGIQNTAHEENFLCERIDQEVFIGDILEQIKRRIESASVVIAELTGDNPNVYLEIGYAWGCRRPTILLLREGQKPKFDVQGQRVITYRRIIDLQKELKKALKFFHIRKT